MSISVTQTDIAGVAILDSQRRGDERGSFMRMFCADGLKNAGLAFTPVHINHSVTAKQGTVRGLHYQNAPALEGKIVRCLKGRIFDVAVDLRHGSPTFLKHLAVELSADNNRALHIPPGCAHGFQALSDDCEMVYLHSAAYAPEHEGGIRHDDPTLSINWPLPVSVLSARDEALPLLDPNFHGVDNAL